MDGLDRVHTTATNRLKLVPPNGEMVQTARDVNISFGD
jgi:hypothetical protein